MSVESLVSFLISVAYNTIGQLRMYRMDAWTKVGIAIALCTLCVLVLDNWDLSCKMDRIRKRVTGRGLINASDIEDIIR